MKCTWKLLKATERISLSDSLAASKKKVCKREGSYHCNIYRIKKNAVKQDILNLHSGVRRREK